MHTPTGDLHDFDFLVGAWTGVNRRLRRRWSQSQDWDEFPSALRCWPLLGGLGNVDDVEFPTRGFRGATVRLFDPARRRWSIYWANSLTGQLFPPVLGGFTGDCGEFFGDDTDDGRPVKVRYRWTRLGPGAARWEQAFSLDGTDWEWNWVMDFTRTG